MLTQRQELVLRLVVDGYRQTGTPVGSRWLSACEGIAFQSSTIRKEFAVLESHGLLEQPHTSAGRVPTQGGYRYFVDNLLSAGGKAERQPGFELSLMQREVDAAMRETTDTLADVTELLALVSAPPITTEEILRVELIQLQMRRLTVVVITSVGGVTKRNFDFEEDVDPGLTTWANGYLNETLRGVGLGARTLRGRLLSPELSKTEAEFIATIAPAFLEPTGAGAETLYVGGTSHLVTENRFQEIPGIDGLIEMLEERASVLGLFRSTMNERGVYLRIGRENATPEFAGAAVVGANYGTAVRNFGTVGLVGPVRMDYRHAISSVRYAAAQLSEFMTDVYA